MRAIVDEDACIGCSACESECPEVFEMNDEDKAVVKVDPVPPELAASCQEAAELCPVDAISIES